jgi:hypothetical protein
MTELLMAATRKGLFLLEPDGEGWNIRREAFLGDPVSLAVQDPASGRVYAALKLGHFGVKLHASDDAGSTWREIACPAFPESEEEGAPSVLEIWAIEFDAVDGSIWVGTIGGGLFHSADGGQSWQLVEALWNHPERKKWFGGGNEAPGIHSICIDPRDHRHLTLAVSCGGVWQSRDKGETWHPTSKGMYAEFMPPDRREDPAIQDPHCLVQCRADPDRLWVQHHNGVFRSIDGGATWRDVTAIQPSKFGFPVAVHPRNPDLAWFVPAIKDECRIPVAGEVVVARTRDGGKTFDVLRQGLPQRHAYDLVLRHALAIDTSGKWLAMGSTSGHLWMSGDEGDRWRLAAGHLPPIYALRFARS